MTTQQQTVVEPALSFFADEADKTFQTLDELRTFLEAEKPRVEMVDRSNFTNLKFDKDSDNRVTMDWGNGPVSVQNTGFSRLCKLLKAPENFLTTLPLDNIRRDVVARLLGMEELQRMALIIKNNRVVGVSKREAPMTGLDVFQKTPFFQTNHKTYRSVGITNNRIQVDCTTTENSPLANDIYGFGMSLVHDDTSGTYPSVSPYSYRIVCANGAIHPKFFGSFRFSSRMSHDKFYESFETKTNDIPATMFNHYATVLSTMSTTPVPEEEKPILGDFLTDRLNWEDGIDGRTAFEAEITRKGTATYYDLMNLVTNYANQLDLHNRRATQIIGSEVFDFFGGESSELFKGYAEHRREYVYAHS